MFCGRSRLLLSITGALLAAGCGRSLDMGRAYDATRAATTIPYTGVRDETRQYADYGAIDASILVEARDEEEAPKRAPAKAPRGKSP